jgi:hypothetical protein
MFKSPVKTLALSIILLSLPLSAQNTAAETADIQGLAGSAVQPRITHAINESSLVTLRGNTHPLAQSKFDLGPAPLAMPASRLILVLARSTEQEAALKTYLQSVQDANSPNFQKFLTPEAFGNSFGVSDADLQTIQNWLTGHGFTVNKVANGRMAIEFSGTVGQVQEAFHTSIHSYRVDGKQQWANATDPQIPSALSPVITGLSSLNSFKPKAQYIRGPSGAVDTQKHTITPTYTNGDATNGYYIYVGPADAATIYNTPTSLNANLSYTTYTGSGVTIGIAGDSNIDITQNANYRSTFGLDANPTTVVVDGADPGENGDAIEAYLDTEVSGGIAPAANVILYTAADTTYQAGLFLGIQRALDDNQVDILSVSFGQCESSLGTSANQFIQDLWEQAAAQGISVTVSAGDGGSAGCDNFDTEEVANQGLAVSGYASTPYNIAVGGTDYDILLNRFTTYVDTTNTLANHRSALKYIPEEPWNDSTYPNTDIAANKPLSAYGATNNIVAGSGGISSLYPVPTWQSGVATGNYRNIPDVSFLAGNGFYGAMWGLCTDLDTDYYGDPITDCASPTTGNNFNLTGVGGTSASAPAFAGMLALLKQKVGTRLGQANYVLYNLAQSDYSTVFHDITTGDISVNCYYGSSGCKPNALGYDFMTGYDAGTGYDLASGWGSVDVSALASNWASASFAKTTSTLQLNGATSALKITHGASVAVSASVTSSSGTPTGDIALVDSISPATQPNSQGITSFTLSGGAVSGTTTFLPGGSYNVSAHYGGNTTDAQSDSNAIPVTVAAESSSTNLTVTAYDPSTGNPSTIPYYGFVFVLDAQPYGNSASATNPNGEATGTITFKSGTSTLGTATLSSEGTAELQSVAIPGGSNSLTAVYPGDASFLANTSAPYAIKVIPSVTALTVPTYSFSYDNEVTFGVYLSANSAGAAPSGTVNFMNGSTSLGSTQLVGTASSNYMPASGTASFTTAPLMPGTYNVTAVYSGDGNYAGSTSAANSFVIGKLFTYVEETTSSSILQTNQSLQVTVTPDPVPGLPVPTGSVTLSYGNVTTAAVNLVSGTATITIPANALPGGFYPITANYSGDTVFLANSNQSYVTVNPAGTINPTVTVIAPTAKVTYPISITVSVSGSKGDPTATGFVTLTSTDPSAYTVTPTQLLTNGSATFSFTIGQNGIQSTLTASYQGDSNYTVGSGTGTVTTLMDPTISFSPSDPRTAINQPLNTTVSVSGPTGYATATGTVTLSSGSYTSSAVKLSGGSASFTIPANSFNLDYNLLVASYSGDSNFALGNNSVSVYVDPAVVPGLTISGTAVIVTPGATTGNTSTITVTPTNGFTGPVNLGCSISPIAANYPATCSFSPASVAISGTSAATSTLTVTTTAASSSALTHPKLPGEPWYAAGGATLACLLLFGIPARRRSWRALLGMLALLALLSGGFLACGGGSSGGGGSTGTTPGNYSITVTASSGSVSASNTISLSVQ